MISAKEAAQVAVTGKSDWSSSVQIQIQIESLHTRLDEIGEMTNAASLYSRTFSQHVYDERAPRDAGGFSFALSTRQALDQGRRAPIAH